MNIFSLYSARNTRPYMDSTVDTRHKAIFNRVRANFFPRASAEEKTRASAAVLVNMTEKFIDFLNEELDPSPPVHSSRRILRKTVQAL